MRTVSTANKKRTIVLLILIRIAHRAPYVMATGPQKEDLAPPTTYCVQYEGSGSKRWVTKSILIDAETLGGVNG